MRGGQRSEELARRFEASRTPEISHDTFVEEQVDFFAGHYLACLPQAAGATPTAPDDYVGIIRFNLGSIAQGASKTVKIHYRGF